MASTGVRARATAPGGGIVTTSETPKARPAPARPCGVAALVLVLVLGALAAAPSAAQFTAVTRGPLGDQGSGFGVAWGDYDNDGDPDLYLVNDGPNLLLRNDGNGNFTDVTSPPLDNAGNGGAAVWGDYDNDGDLDLYLVNYLSANRLFRNDGAAGFTDVTAGPLGDAGAGQGAAWADYDLDGDLDLYLVNYGTPNRLLRNDGGTFVDATSGPLADAGWGVAAAWGDYDNDGDPDLYITNDGPNRLLRNDGGGVFTRVPGLVIEDGGAGQGAAWGDFDNDGDLDLYVANWGTANKLIRNDGGNRFAALKLSPLGDTGNTTGVAWGDYDNDGDLDLYIANYGQANKLLRNDGDSTFVAITSGPLADAGNGTGVAWADYDGDGDLDLYLVNDLQPNVLMRNDLATGAHWLQIDLEGVASNRSAIGARVRLVAGGVSRIREVSGGSGYFSQNSLTVEFGIGAAAIADSLIVSWPSGIVQSLTAVAANQRLALVEPGVVGVESASRIPEPALAAPAPNPSRGEMVLSFALDRAQPVRVTIHDVQGREVATLVDGTRDAGWHSLRWNGRDARRARVSPGIYLARLRTLRTVKTRKIVVVP
jgi:ASPIC/UnbV protein/VCBS repeat protein/flagellar hook capping protein FlgD